ncbi:hypothetical protein GOQ27_15940 [Clostridium sp. D2Q-11]|uniref:Uncharacterized protein n=1 Tax=Anaeromonas frigoriresistens TaxID=2683708 RepID=A0A942UWN4_9FIRM|nr:hypothetical protein [Anaeromonas frigoriresistens]MBS4539968.1 hypothetical protein [Anaeromonas frigoriresistens]
MKNSLFTICKIIFIIVLLLIIIQVSIEEYKYRNEISEPPKSNSILVMSYSYVRNTSIYNFKKILGFYFDL